MITVVRLEPLHFFVGVIGTQRSIPRTDIAFRSTPDLLGTHGGHRHQLLDVLASARGASGNRGRTQHEKLEFVTALGTTVLEDGHRASRWFPTVTANPGPDFVTRRSAEPAEIGA
jgi:hypothetical protein